VTPSQETIIAVQKELTQLGYYHGHVDGLIGPQIEGAIRWFQSVNKLPVTGQIDDSILKALRIS
jgi:peptidoglycan hydrolase-like protein with peptidoglycan-binding domain